MNLKKCTKPLIRQHQTPRVFLVLHPKKPGTMSDLRMICFVNIIYSNFYGIGLTSWLNFFPSLYLETRSFSKPDIIFYCIWEGIENFHSRPCWICCRAFPRNQKVCLLPKYVKIHIEIKFQSKPFWIELEEHDSIFSQFCTLSKKINNFITHQSFDKMNMTCKLFT